MSPGKGTSFFMDFSIFLLFFLKFPGLASYHLLRFFVLLFDRSEKEQGTSMKQERTKNKHETRKKN